MVETTAATLNPFVCARWRLRGRRLPPLSETVQVGDLLRRALMSRTAALYGPDAIPFHMSGHGERGDDGRRMLCLAEDADGDGLVDHLLLHLPGGLDNRCLRVATSLRRLWMGPFGEWQVVENWVARPGEPLGTLVQRAQLWESATPCVSTLHWKRNRSASAMLGALCQRAGLPGPVTAERLDDPSVGGDTDFRHHREGSAASTPDRHGARWRITFAEPVWGPVVLGFNRHYGLGLFRPTDDFQRTLPIALIRR